MPLEQRMTLVPGSSARRLHHLAGQFIGLCVILEIVGITLVIVGTQGIPVAYPAGVTLSLASGLALGWIRFFGYNRVETREQREAAAGYNTISSRRYELPLVHDVTGVILRLPRNYDATATPAQ
ncbi:hypothetical protein [Rhodoglobus sp.]